MIKVDEGKYIKSRLEAENKRLKREMKVREEAIEDLKIKLGDSVSKEVFEKICEEKAFYKEQADIAINCGKESNEAYQKEHSLVISLDSELENVREQLREVKELYVSVGKENEHLKGLVGIYIAK